MLWGVCPDRASAGVLCSQLSRLLGQTKSRYTEREHLQPLNCCDPVSSYSIKLTTFYSFDHSLGRSAPHILDSGLELSQRVEICSCPEVGDSHHNTNLLLH